MLNNKQSVTGKLTPATHKYCFPWTPKFVRLRITTERNFSSPEKCFTHLLSWRCWVRCFLSLFPDSLYKLAFVCTSGNMIRWEGSWEKFPNHIQRHTALQIPFVSQEMLGSPFSGWGHIPSVHFNEIWLFNRISQHAPCSVGKYCANVSHFHSLVLVTDSRFAFYLSSL